MLQLKGPNSLAKLRLVQYGLCCGVIVGVVEDSQRHQNCCMVTGMVGSELNCLDAACLLRQEID